MSKARENSFVSLQALFWEGNMFHQKCMFLIQNCLLWNYRLYSHWVFNFHHLKFKFDSCGKNCSWSIGDMHKKKCLWSARRSRREVGGVGKGTLWCFRQATFLKRLARELKANTSDYGSMLLSLYPLYLVFDFSGALDFPLGLVLLRYVTLQHQEGFQAS